MSQTARPLRAARVARGWSQARAADELATLAAARGVVVAAPASLKTQLSRWENQHALPDEHYRALLRELYETTEADLGLVEPAAPEDPPASDAEQLRARLAESSAIDDAALELLSHQLRYTRALDDRLGAAAAAGAAQAQLSYLENALRHATSARTRRGLGSLVVDAATLAARLAADQGQPTEAWRCHEVAKAGAREADSAPLLGYVLVEQSSVLVEIGEPATALSSVEQAIALASQQAPGSLRAWFEAARGQALASAGARQAAHHAYRKAERELVERPGALDVAFPGLSLPGFDLAAFQRHRGHSYRILGENESAIDDLRSALDARTSPARERGAAHLDLAWAHREIGQHTWAQGHVRAAREIATRIGSRRLASLLNSTQLADRLDELTRS